MQGFLQKNRFDLRTLLPPLFTEKSFFTLSSRALESKRTSHGQRQKKDVPVPRTLTPEQLTELNGRHSDTFEFEEILNKSLFSATWSFSRPTWKPSAAVLEPFATLKEDLL